MEILNFLLPFHEKPLTISSIFETNFILPLAFFITIWGVFFYTIFQVYRTAKPENWENNWFGGKCCGDGLRFRHCDRAIASCIGTRAAPAAEG